MATIRELSQWPERVEDVTVDGIIRAVGVAAQRTWVLNLATISRKDEDGKMIYRSQLQACLGAVGMMGALRALRDANPEAALKFARDYWGMCEDGGAIGEMLWEWLAETGVDPDLVTQAALS